MVVQPLLAYSGSKKINFLVIQVGYHSNYFIFAFDCIYSTFFFIFPVGTTKEHLGYALALGVPIFVVVTKIDSCRNSQVERTIRQLEKLLKSPGCKKVPFRIESLDDAVTAASNFHSER